MSVISVPGNLNNKTLKIIDANLNAPDKLAIDRKLSNESTNTVIGKSVITSMQEKVDNFQKKEFNLSNYTLGEYFDILATQLGATVRVNQQHTYNFSEKIQKFTTIRKIVHNIDTIYPENAFIKITKTDGTQVVIDSATENAVVGLYVYDKKDNANINRQFILNGKTYDQLAGQNSTYIKFNINEGMHVEIVAYDGLNKEIFSEVQEYVY